MPTTVQIPDRTRADLKRIESYRRKVSSSKPKSAKWILADLVDDAIDDLPTEVTNGDDAITGGENTAT